MSDIPKDPNPDESIVGSTLLLDEKHIAYAMTLLQKALIHRSNAYGTDEANNAYEALEIHRCLRDAAYHCEQARLHWTPQYRAKLQQILVSFEDNIPNP